VYQLAGSRGTRSCGCLRHASARFHGHSYSAEYRIWGGIKTRCLRPTSQNFKYYGGRGITICSRWSDSFPAFLADVGRRPTKQHSLDRIDNDGNYEPGNVRWATKREQGNNRRGNVRVSMDGITRTVSEWSREPGARPERTIHGRLASGASPRFAIFGPIWEEIGPELLNQLRESAFQLECVVELLFGQENLRGSATLIRAQLQDVYAAIAAAGSQPIPMPKVAVMSPEPREMACG
jgi:hypothetical protein